MQTIDDKRSFGGLTAFVLPVVVLTMVIADPAKVVAVEDNKGSEFILGFMANLGASRNVLFITGDAPTSGNVNVPGLAFNQPFTITPGAITTITLPSSTAVVGGDVTEHKGVLITAIDEVVVYGINQIPFTTDAFLGLPTDILGTNYIILGRNESLSARGNSPTLGPSEFVVVGVEDATTVEITPSVSTGTRTAGVPFSITLDRLDAYQLQTDGTLEDLSGTTVTSNKQVAVFAGGVCVDIPNGVAFCDHVVEQIPPTSTWGTSFLTVSLATRTAGDLFRVIARDDGTDVFLDGVLQGSIGRAQFMEFDLPSGSTHEIQTTGPALLMQYAKGTLADFVLADPFMMMIPPSEQFLAGYTLSTPDATPVAFNNFINLVVQTGDETQCTIDGLPLAATFTPIGTSGFSGGREPVTIGSHVLSCPSPFGAYAYGWASDDSYGYPGGMALAPIADGAVVAFDIRPTSCRNPLNTADAGMLPAAILGTADFDVLEIDPDSVALIGLVQPQSTDFDTPVQLQQFDYEDVATPFEPFTGKEDPFDCTTEGPDGFVDLTLKFDNQELMAALTQALGQAPQRGQVLVLQVAGNLMDANATSFVGEDVVVVVR